MAVYVYTMKSDLFSLVSLTWETFLLFFASVSIYLPKLEIPVSNQLTKIPRVFFKVLETDM